MTKTLVNGMTGAEYREHCKKVELAQAGKKVFSQFDSVTLVRAQPQDEACNPEEVA